MQQSTELSYNAKVAHENMVKHLNALNVELTSYEYYSYYKYSTKKNTYKNIYTPEFIEYN